jgi:hypothetical protein
MDEIDHKKNSAFFRVLMAEDKDPDFLRVSGFLSSASREAEDKDPEKKILLRVENGSTSP